MANPQPGEFTRLANQLLEAIILTNFTKRQLNIILLVIRLSYGCGRSYAVLRQADFKAIGLDKSDINKELQLLVQRGVLTITGERVAINKDYDGWQVAQAQPGGADRFKQLLKRNLEEKAVGETPTIKNELVGNSPTIANGAVGETPTIENEIVGKTPTIANRVVGKTPTRELVKHQPAGWQNTNSGVGKTPTSQNQQANGGKVSAGAERNIKETLKKIKEKEKEKNKKEKDLCVFDNHFEKFWAVYPRKVEKQRAYRCYKIRIREGLSEGLTMEDLVRDLVNAAANYADQCQRQGTQPRYIKLAATFLGPDKPYLDWLKPPAAEAVANPPANSRPNRQTDEKRKLLQSLYLS